jgi:hypothetical protein
VDTALSIRGEATVRALVRGPNAGFGDFWTAVAEAV